MEVINKKYHMYCKYPEERIPILPYTYVTFEMELPNPEDIDYTPPAGSLSEHRWPETTTIVDLPGVWLLAGIYLRIRFHLVRGRGRSRWIRQTSGKLLAPLGLYLKNFEEFRGQTSDARE